MNTVPNIYPLEQLQGGDQVARRFGVLSGRTMKSAHSWLHRGFNLEVTLALKAHREVGAWGRRESWAAPLVAELNQIAERHLDWDFILEHQELDQRDDGWRTNYVRYQTIESRRQWCRALARFHAVNAQMICALKKESE